MAVKRTSVVTQADLAALDAVLTALEKTDAEVVTLQEMCREKGDSDRLGRCRIARFRLDEARKIMEHAFR